VWYNVGNWIIIYSTCVISDIGASVNYEY
jgi:hypothetical protein